MNNQAKKTVPEATSTPAVVIQKPSYWPMILISFFATSAAVGLTIGIVRHLEKKKREEEAEEAREREESSLMNPTMPMMWPGMMTQQVTPQRPAANEQPVTAHTIDSLRAWEARLSERERKIGSSQEALMAAMTG